MGGRNPQRKNPDFARKIQQTLPSEKDGGEVLKKAVESLESLDLDVFQLKMLTEEGGDCPYEEWFRDLHDRKAQARIQARIKRLERGLFGTCEPVGEGVMELKVDYGPGYRVYYARWGKTIIVLVGGGDKSTQDADIKEAKRQWSKHKNVPERFQ